MVLLFLLYHQELFKTIDFVMICKAKFRALWSECSVYEQSFYLPFAVAWLLFGCIRNMSSSIFLTIALLCSLSNMAGRVVWFVLLFNSYCSLCVLHHCAILYSILTFLFEFRNDVLNNYFVLPLHLASSWGTVDGRPRVAVLHHCTTSICMLRICTIHILQWHMIVAMLDV